MNHTLTLTDEDLRLLQAALHSYLDDFGHEESDVLRRIKDLIARMPTPGVPRRVTVRLVLWNLADSKTTLDELRAKLPETLPRATPGSRTRSASASASFRSRRTTSRSQRRAS